MDFQPKTIRCKIDLNQLIDEIIELLSKELDIPITEENISIKKWGRDRFYFTVKKSSLKLKVSNRERVLKRLEELNIKNEVEFTSNIFRILYEIEVDNIANTTFLGQQWFIRESVEDYYFIEMPYECYIKIINNKQCSN